MEPDEITAEDITMLISENNKLIAENARLRESLEICGAYAKQLKTGDTMNALIVTQICKTAGVL